MTPEMTPEPVPTEVQEEIPHTSKVERVLFWSLAGGIVLMAILLFREHRITLARYSNLSEITPLSAPYVDTESVTLDMADDATGAIAAQQREVALPQDPTIRARALLDRLFVEYALPQSAHPLASSAAIDEVFLVDVPLSDTGNGQPQTDFTRLRDRFSSSAGRVAIVSLRGTFVQIHPSGIAVEDLTLRSIIGTLHANLHNIEQIRFLVDGQPRDTLAGHADLTRAYPVIDTASAPVQSTVDSSSDTTPNTDAQ